jgi:hypothetical protein
MEAHGFAVTVDHSQNLATVAAKYGIPTELQGCHTAIVDGYIVEGHVPAAEVKRMLETQPEIVGLAVPGMPIGSPGMEVAGADSQRFDVIAWDKSGKTTVYAHYPGEPE